MFIRKLFNVGDKAKWLILELLIVFVGVYLAFIFQSYSEQSKIDKEKEKVLVSLKLELEEFRTSFPRFADYQKGRIEEWDSLFDNNEIGTYYSWRYLEPQYNFNVIEYAINQEGTDVLDFELYEGLSQLHAEIKQLEHAERYMTKIGFDHLNIPLSLDKNSDQYKIMSNQNRFNFYKFIDFAGMRENSLRRVATRSVALVEKINEVLGPEKTREVDFMLLGKYLDAKVDQDTIWSIMSEFFPQYTRAEFDAFVDSYN